MEFSVTCITTNDRAKGHRGITHIGNRQNGWRLSAASVMRRIERHQQWFYIWDALAEQRVYIRIRHDGFGGRCLQANYAGRWRDDLVGLPESQESSVID